MTGPQTDEARADTPASSPWATWPAPVFSGAFAAGLDCWLAVNRAWFEAGCALLAPPSPTPLPNFDDPVLQLTLDDLQSCGDAIVKAQIETLESWRQAS